MLIGSVVRPRVVLYIAIASLVLLATRTLYLSPPGSSWIPAGHSLSRHSDDARGGIKDPQKPLSNAATPDVERLSGSNEPNPATSDPKVETHEDHETQGTGDGSTSIDSSAPPQKPLGLDREADANLPCRKLPGAEKVVVIMRTGATEIQDKIPAHFQSTFRCYSDLLIFSDYEEVFMGEQVHDVLRNMDPQVIADNKDFEIYRRLKEGGRSALRAEELSGKLSFEGSKSGKLDNPGWRLDKWKFLPMMRETLNLRPDKEWYVFVESDSYIVWSNLLKYLAALDPKKDIYFGSEVQIGDDLFAHGGSAFTMTRSSVEKAASKYEEQKEQFHKLTHDHWAGDCILGIVLLQAGVTLGWAWPMFQGGHPEKMDFSEWKGVVRIWCSPLLSAHHFNDEELQRFWRFEQNWISAMAEFEKQDRGGSLRRWSLFGQKSRDENLLYGQDVFKAFVRPNFTDYRPQWNSLSPDLAANSNNVSPEECRAICERDPKCVQYTLAPDGCFTGTYAMLGQPWGNVSSGWLLDRVDRWAGELDHCEKWRQGWALT